MPPERTAVLIVRAWVEQHPTAPLRVTVRATTDVAGGVQHTQNFADVEAAVQAVRAWLREVEAHAHLSPF